MSPGRAAVLLALLGRERRLALRPCLALATIGVAGATSAGTVSGAAAAPSACDQSGRFTTYGAGCSPARSTEDRAATGVTAAARGLGDWTAAAAVARDCTVAAEAAVATDPVTIDCEPRSPPWPRLASERGADDCATCCSLPGLSRQQQGAFWPIRG